MNQVEHYLKHKTKYHPEEYCEAFDHVFQDVEVSVNDKLLTYKKCSSCGIEEFDNMEDFLESLK